MRRDGYKWTQDFERGEPKGDLKRGEQSQGHRDDDHLPRRRRGLRDARVRLLDPGRADARDRLPHPRPRDQARRRARRRPARHLPLQGRDRRLRQAPEREQGRPASQARLLRERDRGRRGRGRDAVELQLPGVGVLVRQQHQHPRGRLAPLRLPLGADQDPQRLRPQQGPAEGKGREPDRRRRPRGAHRGDLREARRPAVRGPDEGEARQPAGRGPGQGDRQPEARRVPRGASGGRAADRLEVGRRRPRPPRGPQGPRSDPAQVGARELDPARQARRLHGPRPVAGGAVHRRGRLGRRLGEAGPRPQHAGGAAAAGQDPQRREEPHRQGALERDDLGDDHRDRHRRRRGLQPARTRGTTRSS